MCVCKEEYESEFTGGRCENGVYEKGNGSVWCLREMEA